MVVPGQQIGESLQGRLLREKYFWIPRRMTTTAPTIPTTVSDADRRRIIIGVLICMLLAALDQTIVAPVIPILGATLGGSSYISWIVSAYFLAATATTPLYGKIADIYGRRPTLLAAVAIFVTGSVLCALAPNMGTLIAGRTVQGLGGGGLMALSTTVIGDLMPPKERGKIAGYIAIMWGTASIGGPILGGVIAEHAHWSWIFWLNLPLAAVAVATVNASLKRLPWQRRKHALDILGAGLVIVATVCVLLALALGPQSAFGWRSPTVLALMAAGVLLIPVIARHMRQAPEPLIPLAVLSNEVVRFAVSSLFFVSASGIAMAVFVPMFLELAHGRTAEQAGIALVGYMMGTVLSANVAGQMTARVTNYKSLPVLGLAVAAVALAWIAWRAPTIGLWEFECVLIIVGAGAGLQYPVTTIAVQNAVDQRDLGVASGLLAFSRALGSSIGVAAVGAVGAASGIAINDASSASGLVAVPAGTFTPVFAAAAVAVAISWVMLWRMPMLALKGKA